METETRKKIKDVVLKSRKLLEDDIAQQLEGDYGLRADGRHLDVKRLTHLTYPERQKREALLAAIDKGKKSGHPKTPDAYRFYIKESAFTYLNRLAALRCLEVRGLIAESLIRREGYSNLPQGLFDLNEGCGEVCQAQADGGYARYLKLMFDEVGEEIRILFNTEDEYSLLFPSPTCLAELVRLLTEDIPESAWAENEIIGWFYQYFNIEEKEKVRKAGRPKTPDNVAVINQFYTPAWIVRFLVQNTLGRLWLEMKPDSPLAYELDYLVRRKDEEFPKRSKKEPTEIRLLDPAAGSGHFLLYAFDLFARIYEEEGYLYEEIPNLILEHNLYGIDIDLRATQLAQLALYLKAKSYAQEHGFDCNITGANVVCADAMPLSRELLDDFLVELNEPTLQRVVEKVWENLAQARELGSLLKAEEAMRSVIREEKRLWAQRPINQQLEFIPSTKPEQLTFDFSDVKDEQFWESLESRIVQNFHELYRKAAETQDFQRQIFASEGEKGFQFLDLLLNNYDVVVMNPPYGNTMNSAQKDLRKAYPISYPNILCTFLERGLDLICNLDGFVGAIVDKSFMFRNRYENFRSEIIIRENRLQILTDLGGDILDDANVETVALVLRSPLQGGRNSDIGIFFRVDNRDNKPQVLSELIQRSYTGDIEENNVFGVRLDEFHTFPNKSISYWVPSCIRRMFNTLPSLDPTIADARVGLIPGDAARFYRYFWEVKFEEIGVGCKWALLSNGGIFSPFYRSFDQVVYWENNGYVIKNFRDDTGYLRSGPYNQQYYFQEGITYGKRGHFFNVQYLPPNFMFSDEGQGIFPHQRQDIWFLIGLLNSQLIRTTINTYCGQHKHCGYVKLLPYKNPEVELHQVIATLAREAHNLKAAWDNGNETCTGFGKPWLLQRHTNDKRSSAEQLDSLLVEEQEKDAELQSLQAQIDEAVYELYEISQEDRELIERELGERPPELVWPQMEGKSEEDKRLEHTVCLVSYFFGCLMGRWDIEEGGLLTDEKRENIVKLQRAKASDYPVPIQEDGILALDDSRHDDIVRGIRRCLAAVFGEAEEYAIEQEIIGILGKPLDDFFLKDFFPKWHVKKYKKRPIYWQLVSPKKNYTLYLYYHCLTDDTLSKVLVQFLDPKIQEVETQLERMERQRLQLEDDKRALASHQKEMGKIADFLAELREFRESIEGVIPNFHPDIDAGVKANSEPLIEEGILNVRKL